MYEPEGGNVVPSGVQKPQPRRRRAAKRGRPNIASHSRVSPPPPGRKHPKLQAGIGAHTQGLQNHNAMGVWVGVQPGRRPVGKGGRRPWPGPCNGPLNPDRAPVFSSPETIPEIAAIGRALPSVADRRGRPITILSRGLGLLIGAYERRIKFLAEKAAAADFATNCFPSPFPTISTQSKRTCCVRRDRARFQQGRHRRASKSDQTEKQPMDLVAGQRAVAVRRGNAVPEPTLTTIFGCTQRQSIPFPRLLPRIRAAGQSWLPSDDRM